MQMSLPGGQNNNSLVIELLSGGVHLRLTLKLMVAVPVATRRLRVGA